MGCQKHDNKTRGMVLNGNFCCSDGCLAAMSMRWETAIWGAASLLLKLKFHCMIGDKASNVQYFQTWLSGSISEHRGDVQGLSVLKGTYTYFQVYILVFWFSTITCFNVKKTTFFSYCHTIPVFIHCLKHSVLVSVKHPLPRSPVCSDWIAEKKQGAPLQRCAAFQIAYFFFFLLLVGTAAARTKYLLTTEYFSVVTLRLEVVWGLWVRLARKACWLACCQMQPNAVGYLGIYGKKIGW